MDKVTVAISMNHPVMTESPDSDTIAQFNDMRDNAMRLIASVVHSKGGRLIGDFEGSTIVEIPLQDVGLLKDLKKRIADETGVRMVAMGVGESVDDAMVALREAKKESCIKVFKPEMVEQSVEPKSVAVGEETEPVRKAEVTPEAQKTIASLVGKIGQNREYVESLKTNNPPAYEALIEVMQAIASMVSHVKDSHMQKVKGEELDRLEKVVESSHDGRLDGDEKAILNEMLNDLRSKADVKKAEGDYGDVMAATVQKLHSAIPFFEQVRSEKPEVFGSFVKLVRLLQTFHEDHGQVGHKDTQSGSDPTQSGQDAPHVRPPAHSEKITHPKPTYAPGSVRQYSPEVARQKTQSGDWKSVAGGVKREE